MALQPGSYKAVVTEHHWTTSKANTPGLALSLDVLDGFGGCERMLHTIWFSDKAMNMARAQLKELGFDANKQHARDIGNGISFVDRECNVVLDNENYGGRTTLKVKKIGGLPKPPTAAQLSALDAALAAAKKSGGKDDDTEAFERANQMVPSDESLSGNFPTPPPTPPPAEDALPF